MGDRCGEPSDQGKAILLVSVELEEILGLSDRIAVMYLGEIVEMTAGETLFAAPKHPYTKALMSAIPRPDPLRPITFFV